MSDAMAASAAQSAAEGEEDLVLLQQTHQLRHTAASSAFSTSSVDQFLRDNGFQIGAFGGDDDALSSSADGEFAGVHHAVARARGREEEAEEAKEEEEEEEEEEEDAVERLLRGDAISSGGRESERRMEREERDHGGGARGRDEDAMDVLSSDDGSHSADFSTAAGEEGDQPTPRFILLDDEDLLSMTHEAASPVSSSVPQQRPSSTAGNQHGSFDRSLLLGGSGLSALSEESARLSATAAVSTERPRVPTYRPEPRRLAERDTGSVKGPRASLIDRLVASSSSSSSSASYASSPSAFSSSRDSNARDGGSSKRSQDDELSDALGVRSSLVSQERASTVGSRQRLEPRRLAPHDEEEKSERPTRPAPRAPSTNPWTRVDRRDGDGSASEDGGSSVQRTQWEDFNILLRKNGLPTVQLRESPSQAVVPDHSSMVNLVQEFLLQLSQKNETIQDLVIDSNRTYKVQSKAEGDLTSLERKNDELRKSLQSAQSEVRRLQEKVQHQKEETETQTKGLKASCLKLQQQLKVSEHRVKAKEVLVERMQKRLQQQVDKESLNKTRDRKIFKQLQQRDPRKTNAKDNQSLECISIYESQREQMQEEIEHLRSQVAALNSELRDKENTLSRRSSASQASVQWSESGGGRASGGLRHSFDVSDDMLMRLEAARREQEQAAAKLRQREAIMVKKISAIEAELLVARETIAELKDENANLTLEAESRPSIRDYRLSQRRIHQLERQLSENKLALEEANDINELRRFMGTTDLIERDRLNHRLHLNRLGTLPKETLLEVVKEVCRVLNLTDITLITPSLHKMCNVVTAVPRMEKFIRDVCGFVYFNHGGQASQQEDARFELEQVIPTLQQWMAERKKLFELEGFKTAVVTELCKRSVEPNLLRKATSGDSTSASQLSNLPRAVQIVAELVELEKSVFHHREIYTHAAEELERRPGVLVNQIVRHFSHLFHVKSVDGVLPKINEVYLFVSEMENFLKAVRSLLVLKPDASLVVCVDAIRSLVEGEYKRPEQPEDIEDQDQPNYVIEKSTRGRVDPASGGVAGVREVREMSVLVRDLKKELGAATMQEILPRTRRLMELLSLSIHQTPADEDF